MKTLVNVTTDKGTIRRLEIEGQPALIGVEDVMNAICKLGTDPTSFDIKGWYDVSKRYIVFTREDLPERKKDKLIWELSLMDFKVEMKDIVEAETIHFEDESGIICLKDRFGENANPGRINAMKWWNELSSLERTRVCDTNTDIVGHVRRWETLTGREIELLFNKETKKGESHV